MGTPYFQTPTNNGSNNAGKNRPRHNLLQALLHCAVKLIPLAFPINFFWLAIALP
jgi:hypothetical protein